MLRCKVRVLHISLAASCCGVTVNCWTFDGQWFIVTGNNVTINEAKLDEVAARIAPCVSSQIVSSTGATVIDTWYDESGYKGYNGEIVANVDTTSGCSAVANIQSRSTS